MQPNTSSKNQTLNGFASHLAPEKKTPILCDYSIALTADLPSAESVVDMDHDLSGHDRFIVLPANAMPRDPAPRVMVQIDEHGFSWMVASKKSAFNYRVGSNDQPVDPTLIDQIKEDERGVLAAFIDPYSGDIAGWRILALTD